MSRSLLSAPRRLLVSSCLATASIVVPAARAVAQAADAARATHTVKAGDTLWSLARLYLGDPFQWPEVYRLNPDVVEDPHWIYPGEVLKIPARANTGATVAQGGGNPTLTPAAGTPEPGPVEPVMVGNESATVFASIQRRSQTGQRVGKVLAAQPAVRAGEFSAAPFLSKSGGPSGSGRILSSVEVESTLLGPSSGERRLQYAERVAVVAPAGRAASVGDLYLAYTLGGSVDGRQVINPTAILRVEDAPGGKAPVARIVRVFDGVVTGQQITSFEPVVSDSIRPVAVANGRVTQIIGMQGNEMIPGLQNYIYFPLTTRDGVRAGDQLTIFQRGKTEGGVAESAIDLATVTLVRVTDQGATGLVIEQSSGRFETGTPARISARLP